MRFPVVLLALLFVPAALLSQDQTMRIRVATVIDGAGKTLKNATIVVRGSKITDRKSVV